MGGRLTNIMGSITDITLQKRSAKDAETRAKLSEQLLLRTQEAKENEKNFKRFSDLAPGGLVIMDPIGKITYANAQWFTISGHPQDSTESNVPLSWTNTILEDDQEYLASKWEELITQKTTITLEVRMQIPWEGDIGGSVIKIPRWILASIYPEVSESGELLSVMGCKSIFFPYRVSALLTGKGITDISRIKWAENLQARRLHEAEETRRAQNSFIDITSHEMRNPLSNATFP
jgi:PAS domain-containing protein